MDRIIGLMKRATMATTIAAIALLPAVAQTQVTDTATKRSTPQRSTRLSLATGEPRLSGGLTAVVGQPIGAFHDFVDHGFGVGLHGLGRLGQQGFVAVRLDAGFLNYGNETIRMPLGTSPGGGRVRLNVRTSNNIFWLGAGPQLMAPRGPVRPYVNGTAGFSYFATTSSVSGRSSDDMPFAHDTNHDDAQFSWGTGGGLVIPFFRNATSQGFIDIGVRYHDNGREVRYLRKGGIRDLPNGDVALDVIRSRADLLTWHVGASIGGR